MRAFLITALFLVSGCGAADALDAAKVEAVTKASEQFVALAKGSHLTGHPPRQNDAAVNPLLDLLFDVSEVQQSSGTYKIADFNNLNAWNRAVLKAGLVYVLANNGVLDAYQLATGEEVYRQRLPLIGSGFSASPIAADGKIYLSNEDGEMLVVAAG